MRSVQTHFGHYPYTVAIKIQYTFEKNRSVPSYVNDGMMVEILKFSAVFLYYEPLRTALSSHKAEQLQKVIKN